MTGIYSITNTVNGKKYIGQSIDIKRRLREHKSKLTKGIHSNNHMQRAWNENPGTFNFDILLECSKEKLDELEMHYVNLFDTYKNGYNQTYGGDGAKGYRKFEFSQDQINEIIEMRKNLTIIADIAKHFKVSHMVILRIFKEHCPDLRISLKEIYALPRYREIYHEPKRKYTHQEIKHAIDKRNKGTSLVDIAKELKTCEKTLKKFLLEFYPDLAKPIYKAGATKINKANAYPLSEEQIADILKRRELKESRASIAKGYGCSETVIVRIDRIAKAA